MQLLKAPEPFSPAFGEVLYAVSLEESERGEEISIFNSAITEKIGVKKVLESPVSRIHVTDYLRSQLAIEPFAWQGCGIIEAHRRVFQSCIAWQDWASITPHTAGIVPMDFDRALREDVPRTLAEDEQDEICWVATPGIVAGRILVYGSGANPVEIDLEKREVSHNTMLACIINGPDLCAILRQRGYNWNRFSGFTLEIHSSYQLIIRADYLMAAASSEKIRLAWWNRQGGIDFYSFPSLQSVVHETRSRTIPLSESEKDLGAAERRNMRVVAPVKTLKLDAWLSQIMGAPRVWLITGEDYLPVRILTDSMEVYQPDKTEIELAFELSDPISFQSF